MSNCNGEPPQQPSNAPPFKQVHIAKRIYDRLVAERGFGHPSDVREYVGAWKRANEGEAAFASIPLRLSA